jgi:hypothetical protein
MLSSKFRTIQMHNTWLLALKKFKLQLLRRNNFIKSNNLPLNQELNKKLLIVTILLQIQDRQVLVMVVEQVQRQIKQVQL